MNTKLTLTAITLFAVIMGMSVLAPAMAAKESKVLVCHYQEFVAEDLTVDPPIIGEEEAWKVININGNAESAHVDVHTPDGVVFDFLIAADDDDDAGDLVNDSVADCEDLDNAL